MESPNQQSQVRSLLLQYSGQLLSRSGYLRSKLEQKLIQKLKKNNHPVDKQLINSVLNELEKAGYLNDSHSALSLVRNELKKGYGPRYIEQKLKFLKISPQDIRSAITQECTHEAITQAIDKVFKKYPRLDPQKIKQKLYQRGFSSSYPSQTQFDSDQFND